MTDDENILRYIEDGDNIFIYDSDAVGLQVRNIAAEMLLVDKSYPASRSLMKLHSETKSPSYVREVANQVTLTVAGYLLEAAYPSQMPIAFTNLNHFMLAYRTLRPVDEDPDMRAQASDQDGSGSRRNDETP